MGELKTLLQREKGVSSGNLIVNGQHRNIENDVKAEDCEIKEMDYAPLTHNADLKF